MWEEEGTETLENSCGISDTGLLSRVFSSSYEGVWVGRTVQVAQFSPTKPGVPWLELIVSFTRGVVVDLATSNILLSPTV